MTYRLEMDGHITLQDLLCFPNISATSQNSSTSSPNWIATRIQEFYCFIFVPMVLLSTLILYYKQRQIFKLDLLRVTQSYRDCIILRYQASSYNNVQTCNQTQQINHNTEDQCRTKYARKYDL